MSNPPKDKDQEKGDEVLRRLLKTPPKPKQESGKRKGESSESKKTDKSTGES